MNLPATSNGSTSGSIVAAASCICASAFAVSVSEAGSGTSYRSAISVISWSTGPSWISFSDDAAVAGHQRAELLLERLDVQVACG